MTKTEQAATQSMVERVARAIHYGEAQHFIPGALAFEALDADRQEQYFEMANAAIEAWKTLTDAEIDAAIEAAGIPWGFGHTEGRQFINALVDAALSEEGE